MEYKETDSEKTKNSKPEESQEGTWDTVDWLNESTEDREERA